jgi:tRNA uridine 5-carboxymethylaminomethyl modification enzyme
MFQEEYDVIVVGAGHAGSEAAAAAAANLGSKPFGYNEPTETLRKCLAILLGGIAKGQIVREIDALGGYSGIVSDRTAIHLRC